MLLTDRFVFVHLPKCGGTFCTRTLERLLEPSRAKIVAGKIGRRLFGRALVPLNYEITTTHAPCGDIPDAYRGKPIIAAVRDPLSRHVSMYNHRWWKDRPASHVDWDHVRECFPTYPELSFGDFVRMLNDHVNPVTESSLPQDERPGYHTRQHVRYFFRHPEKVLRRLDDDYVESGRYREDMFPVRFLHQESLNDDLHDALIELGYSPESVAFIRQAEPILPPGVRSTVRPKKKYSDYWTPELIEEVRRRERYFFEWFPEYQPETRDSQESTTTVGEDSEDQ